MAGVLTKGASCDFAAGDWTSILASMLFTSLFDRSDRNSYIGVESECTEAQKETLAFH